MARDVNIIMSMNNNSTNQTSTPYPTNIDYKRALQNPSFAFLNKDLGQLEILKRGNDLHFATGNFAIAFKANNTSSNKNYAIKCFTRSAGERRERYDTVSRYLQSHKLSSLVSFEYLSDSVRVFNDPQRKLPIVKMEWVEGKPLKDWLSDCCQSGNSHFISELAEKWMTLIQELRDHQLAHGDLQHGNILVTSQNELRLVDYDGMSVPDLIGKAAMEIGLPGYQHPQRVDRKDVKLSLDLDNFSSIIVYVGLKAIAWDPTLFKPEENEYGLLFSELDFRNPDQSQIFKTLSNTTDDSLRKWADKILMLLKVGLEEIPSLQEFLNDYQQIKTHLEEYKYDEAVELFKKTPSMSLPADVKAGIEEAIDRIQLRKDLLDAEKQGDERRMADLYDPALLANYPAAQQIATIAKSASQVAPVIERIHKAINSNKGDEVVKIWNDNISILTCRTSAASLKNAVDQWGQRIKLRTEVLSELDRSIETLVPQLKPLYHKLHQLGGHPDVDHRLSEIQLAINRNECLGQLHEFLNEVNYENDKVVSQTWNEKLLKGWQPAEENRPQAAQALKRLKLFEPVRSLLRSDTSKSLNDEMLILEVKQKLPNSYSDSLDQRSVYANRWVDLCNQAESLVSRAGESEKQLSDCWHQVGEVKHLLKPTTRERLELAAHRAPILETLSQIPVDLHGLEYDEALIRNYDEGLLNDCDEAVHYKKEFEVAKKRRSLLKSIEQARTVGDDIEVKRLAEDPLLNDFTLNADTELAIKRAIRSAAAASHLMDLAKANQEHQFACELDIQILRKYWSQFRPYHVRICQWLSNGALATNNIGLSRPRVGHAVKLVGNNLHIKWLWPGRITNRCLVTVSRVQIHSASQIEKAAMHLEISKDNFEHGGGCFLPLRDDLSNAYLNVWAIVELGNERYYSAPLTLGRIPRSI